MTRAEGKNRKRVAAKAGLEMVVTDHAQDRILSESAADPRMSVGPDRGLERALGLAEPDQYVYDRVMRSGHVSEVWS